MLVTVGVLASTPEDDVRDLDLKPITGTGQMEPDTVVYLDLRAEVRFEEDGDGALTLVLSDGKTEVLIDVPKHPDAGLQVSSLGWRIIRKEPEVRARTNGYREQHNAVNGPGMLGPITKS